MRPCLGFSGCQKYDSSLIFVIKLGPQICTLGTQTCTLCFTIASDIFASTFLPHSLTTIKELSPVKT